VEHRFAAPEHGGVEDDCRIRSALVGGDVVDDLVAARLLFAVADKPDVHGELAGLREVGRGLEERVQLSLVVGRAAAVEPAVANRRLERRRLPLVERRGGLHVEVAVDEEGGRVFLG
jgi:hypothetical protein